MKRVLILIISLIYFSSGAIAQKFPKAKCSTLLGNAMFKEVDTSKSRGLADNYHTWENGITLLVKFLPGGSKLLRDKVMENAKEWNKYANITLKFIPDSSRFANIRVKLSRGLGHNSTIGTEANFRSQSDQTINFDTIFFADGDYYAQQLKDRGIVPPYNYDQLIAEVKRDPNHWNNAELRRVVMHEFGHSLGLLHEQSYPGAINWKKTDSVYNYYEMMQGWDKDKVDFNVFEVNNQFYTNGTTYDPKSIMHYSIEPWQTTDGFSVKDNFEISAGDKTLIAALYPKTQKTPATLVPKVDVTNFTKLNVVTNMAKNGLSIFPSFDLKTNSKLGQVYFVARLADEDGYYIETDNENFNWGGAAAIYRKINLLPNSKISYNKLKKNLELFLPFDQIPELNDRKVIVTFSIYLDDVKNGQLEKLMYFSTTKPLSITTK